MPETPPTERTGTDPDSAGLLGQFGAAWTLLSRFPWPFAVPADLGAIGRGAWAFPILGALLGGIAGGAYWLTREIGVPPLVAAAIAFALLAFATGALHEDGLADTADGFGGGRTRARKLEIMRDSRIGTYGVVALVFVTLIRVGAVAALDGPQGFAALLAAGALARGIAAVPMCLLPHARADGLGRSAGRAPAPAAAIAIILGIGIALLAALGYGHAPQAIGIAIALAMLAALFVSLLAVRHIGGTTGDVLGATILAAEATALASLAAG